MRGPMAVDVALHTADRETPKVIPADPMVGLVLVTRNGPRKRPIVTEIV